MYWKKRFLIIGIRNKNWSTSDKFCISRWHNEEMTLIRDHRKPILEQVRNWKSIFSISGVIETCSSWNYSNSLPIWSDWMYPSATTNCRFSSHVRLDLSLRTRHKWSLALSLHFVLRELKMLIFGAKMIRDNCRTSRPDLGWEERFSAAPQISKRKITSSTQIIYKSSECRFNPCELPAPGVDGYPIDHRAAFCTLFSCLLGDLSN